MAGAGSEPERATSGARIWSRFDMTVVISSATLGLGPEYRRLAGGGPSRATEHRPPATRLHWGQMGEIKIGFWFLKGAASLSLFLFLFSSSRSSSSNHLCVWAKFYLRPADYISRRRAERCRLRRQLQSSSRLIIIGSPASIRAGSGLISERTSWLVQY